MKRLHREAFLSAIPWGNGLQTRSFMYIDDRIKGFQLILNSYTFESINLGSSEAVSINQLVDVVEDIAGIELKRKTWMLPKK